MRIGHQGFTDLSAFPLYRDPLGVPFLHAEFLARGRATGVQDVSHCVRYARPTAPVPVRARAFHGACATDETSFSGRDRGSPP